MGTGEKEMREIRERGRESNCSRERIEGIESAERTKHTRDARTHTHTTFVFRNWFCFGFVLVE